LRRRLAMATVLTEEQIGQALLLADAGLAAAGHSYHDPDHEEDIREALRGRISFDEVVRRGVERIRGRG
jgi:hypothetical protein